MNYLLRKRIAVLLIALLLISACAGAQQAYNAMTPEQQKQVRLDFYQSQLTGLYDQGKTFVTANPQYHDVWITKVIPALTAANNALRAAIINAKTPDDVDAIMAPLTNAILILLPVFTGGK